MYAQEFEFLEVCAGSLGMPHQNQQQNQQHWFEVANMLGEHRSHRMVPFQLLQADTQRCLRHVGGSDPLLQQGNVIAVLLLTVVLYGELSAWEDPSPSNGHHLWRQ